MKEWLTQRTYGGSQYWAVIVGWIIAILIFMVPFMLIRACTFEVVRDNEEKCELRNGYWQERNHRFDKCIYLPNEQHIFHQTPVPVSIAE